MKTNNLQIWAVINLTSDSFVPDSRVKPELFLNTANKYLHEGANILDVGAESSRPFASPITVTEELKRLAPLETLTQTKNGTEIIKNISVDTHKAEVARKVLQWGVSFINDIRAGESDGLLQAVSEHKAGIVLMHSKGTPEVMQVKPQYKDIVTETIDFLKQRTEKALKFGIDEKKIIWDFGIGFGKTLEHNLILLNNVERFKQEGFPLLVGVSRKSLMEHLLGIQEVEKRGDATLVFHTYLALQGVDILRVHDVTPAIQMKRILAAVEANGNQNG
ncbi:MAG: dihydropteroate synthase [Leptospirales bacterium]